LQTLKNYDIAGVTTPEEGLELIRINLIDLQSIAFATDFTDAAGRANFCNNIAFIKRFYERVDMLLAQRGE